MRIFEINITDQDQTIDLSHKLGSQLTPGNILCLKGDLGSGKTFMCKHIIGALTKNNILVTSPSFQIVQTYALEQSLSKIYHYDMYRLKHYEEIYELGIEDALSGHNICIIEWPEIIDHILPKDKIEIEILLEAGKRKCIVKDGTKKLKL